MNLDLMAVNLGGNVISGWLMFVTLFSQLDQGGLQLSSRLGSNRPIRMKTPGLVVSDGIWHTFQLISQNSGLQLILDGQPVGEELDAASAHDFLDPYLTNLAIGGTLDNTPTNTIYNGAFPCLT